MTVYRFCPTCEAPHSGRGLCAVCADLERISAKCHHDHLREQIRERLHDQQDQFRRYLSWLEQERLRKAAQSRPNTGDGR